MKKLTLGFIKIKTSCSLKYIVNSIKMKATDLEKMFSKYVSDKVLIYKIYKKHLKLKQKYNK